MWVDVEKRERILNKVPQITVLLRDRNDGILERGNTFRSIAQIHCCPLLLHGTITSCHEKVVISILIRENGVYIMFDLGKKPNTVTTVLINIFYKQVK